jgi:hypothetical protein
VARATAFSKTAAETTSANCRALALLEGTRRASRCQKEPASRPGPGLQTEREDTMGSGPSRIAYVVTNPNQGSDRKPIWDAFTQSYVKRLGLARDFRLRSERPDTLGAGNPLLAWGHRRLQTPRTGRNQATGGIIPLLGPQTRQFGRKPASQIGPPKQPAKPMQPNQKPLRCVRPCPTDRCRPCPCRRAGLRQTMRQIGIAHRGGRIDRHKD